MLFQPHPATHGAAAKLESNVAKSTGETFYKLFVGLEPIGADSVVDPTKGPYGSYFLRAGLDSQDKPGEPGGLLVRLRNCWFAPGTPERSPERKVKALATLAQVIKEEGLSFPSDSSAAYQMASAMCAALSAYRPFILGRTYLTAAQEYIDNKTGESKTRQPRLGVADWTDATEASLAEHGVTLWDGPGNGVPF